MYTLKLNEFNIYKYIYINILNKLRGRKSCCLCWTRSKRMEPNKFYAKLRAVFTYSKKGEARNLFS